MGINYNKEIITKDRAKLTSSPRDRQLKLQAAKTNPSVTNDELVLSLKNQIQLLQEQLSNGVQGYTTEQVNNEITAAIKEETAVLRGKNNELESELKKLRVSNAHLTQEVDRLKVRLDSTEKDRDQQVSSLKEIIASKDALISSLGQTSAPASDKRLEDLLSATTKKLEDMSLQLNNLQAGAGAEVAPTSSRPQMETVFVDPIETVSNVENHVEIKDISITKKEQLNDKVDKLKKLMGKLPSKRPV